jgi:hypothetical protein
MFTTQCAFERTQAGIIFLPSDAVADDHPRLCDLRVHFSIGRLYPPENDNGSGLTWDGGIASIEWLPYGTDPFVIAYDTAMHHRQPDHWLTLRNETFDAAKTFLLRYHGNALWQQESDAAHEQFYGEAA